MAQSTFRNSIEEAKAAAEKLTAERLKDVVAAQDNADESEDRASKAQEAEVVDQKPGKK